MADFCFQCSVEMYFGPSSDLCGLSTEEDTRNKLYPVVLCEGCGPCQVDHLGWCVSSDCAGMHGSPDMPPDRYEVYRRARAWLDRRSGPLGPLLRLRDTVLGSIWEPGLIHCHPKWSWWYDLYRSLRTGVPLSEFRCDDPISFFTEEDEKLYGTPPDGTNSQTAFAAGVETASQDDGGPQKAGVVRGQDLG